MCGLIKSKSLKSLLNSTIKKRESLISISDAMRVVNSVGDGCDGLIIDRYGSHVILYIYDLHWHPMVEAIIDVLRQHFTIEQVVIKDRIKTASSNAADVKSIVLDNTKPTTTTVTEYGLQFKVDSNEGLNAGLFLDMRANRRAIGLLTKGKRVLNCFAYTCAFGVHARSAGAREVVNVDLSRHYLTRGKENYALNNLPVGQGEFLCFDAVEFLTKAQKKQNLFDVIVIDPPSFARMGKKTFQVKRDLPALIGSALECLSPKGVLFVSTNCSTISYQQLEAMVVNNTLPSVKISYQRVSQDIDFPSSNTFKESYLVGLTVRIK